MCFGWYQELLSEARVDGLAAAESKLLQMLDRDGMIVHAYRESDPENPELVGRHSRLRSFIAAGERDASRHGVTLPHELERFLLDPAHLQAWARALREDGLLERRWSVVDLWPTDFFPQEESNCAYFYGKAIRISSITMDSADLSAAVPRIDHVVNRP